MMPNGTGAAMPRDNFTGACDRCHRIRPWVVGAAFRPDASFIHLCVPCSKIMDATQPVLFAGAPVRSWEPEEFEPAPVIERPRPQLDLFSLAELRQSTATQY